MNEAQLQYLTPMKSFKIRNFIRQCYAEVSTANLIGDVWFYASCIKIEQVSELGVNLNVISYKK